MKYERLEDPRHGTGLEWLKSRSHGRNQNRKQPSSGPIDRASVTLTSGCLNKRKCNETYPNARSRSNRRCPFGAS